MPKMSNIELLKQMEQPTLTIRTTVKVEDLPMVMKLLEPLMNIITMDRNFQKVNY